MRGNFSSFSILPEPLFLNTQYLFFAHLMCITLCFSVERTGESSDVDIGDIDLVDVDLADTSFNFDHDYGCLPPEEKRSKRKNHNIM